MQIKNKQTSTFKHLLSLFWLSFQTNNISCSFGTLWERLYAFLLRCVENEVKSVAAICISQVVRDYIDEGVEWKLFWVPLDCVICYLRKVFRVDWHFWLSSFLSQAKFSAGITQKHSAVLNFTAADPDLWDLWVSAFFFLPALNLSEKNACFVALFICLVLCLQRNENKIF